MNQHQELTGFEALAILSVTVLCSLSRRQIWNILKSSKGQKVIVLTTHLMEEADALGDRIGIMNRGSLKVSFVRVLFAEVLQCCGTAMFLKNKFGTGYFLSLVVDENSK